MKELPKLAFPAIRLRGRRTNGRTEVWCAARGCWLVLTPEEWVRRHLVAYLVAACGAEPLRIVEEYPVPLNGQPQRADVVVVDAAGAPLLVAECKAAGVGIDRAVFDQAVRYNSVLGARYLVLTNGLKHYCFRHDEAGRYEQLAGFPVLK